MRGNREIDNAVAVEIKIVSDRIGRSGGSEKFSMGRLFTAQIYLAASAERRNITKAL